MEANNTMTNGSSLLNTATGIISEGSTSYTDQVLTYLYICVQLVIIPVFNFVPIATNIINMAVLYRQGLNNCVNLCLFCLSAADLTSVVTGVVFITATYLIHFNLRPGIDPLALYFVMVYVSSIHYDIANTLTAFLSFERCLCVVLPLKFKDIITFRRGACAICFIYIGINALWVPHYLSFKVTYLQDGANSTRYLGLELYSNRADVDLYLDTVAHFGLTSFVMIIVCVCTQVMIVSLRQSSRFQKFQERPDISANEKHKVGLKDVTLTTASGNNDKQKRIVEMSVIETPITTQKHKVQSSDKQDNTINTKPTNTSLRNRSVMNIVIRLCFICFVCNAIRLVVIASKKVFPEFNFNREHELWFQLAVALAYGLQLLNCTLNITVYYRYNRSFREILQKLFCRPCTNNYAE